MYLREVAAYADEKIVDRFRGGFVGRFHTETCCITEIYRVLLAKQKVRTNDIAKLCIKFVDTVAQEPLPELAPSRLEWPFDFAAYVTCDPQGKKLAILKGVHSAVCAIAKQEGWDLSPFEEVRVEIERRNMTWEGDGTKSWLSPKRNWRVKIHFRFELEFVEFSAVLTDARSHKELARGFLGRGIPETGCLDYYMTNGVWASDTIIELQAATFIRETWRFDTDTIDSLRNGGT